MTLPRSFVVTGLVFFVLSLILWFFSSFSLFVVPGLNANNWFRLLVIPILLILLILFLVKQLLAIEAKEELGEDVALLYKDESIHAIESSDGLDSPNDVIQVTPGDDKMLTIIIIGLIVIGVLPCVLFMLNMFSSPPT